MRRVFLCAAMSVSAVVLGGCTSSTNPGLGKADAQATQGADAAGGTVTEGVCEPGRSAECACPSGAQGAQSCADDGARWLACVCEGPAPGDGAVPTGDAGGTGGHTADAETGLGGKPQHVDGGPADGGVPPSQPPASGAFVVRLVAPVPAQNGSPAIAGVTSLAGRVNDGPTPVGVEWTPTHQDGACQLLEPSVPFCDPPCGGAALCVHEGVCQAYPRAHSVGTVHVTGIRTHAGANAFDVDPVGNQYQYSDAPFPGFEDGDPLRVGTGGGDYDPFTVPGTGITPLDVPATEFTLRAGQPLSVDWAPPPVPGTSTIHVKLDISHHGGSRGAIECDAPDTGHLEVGAGLVRDLLDLGVAGFPTIGIARKTVGSVDIAVGRVDLIVTSDVERPIVVPGVVSCTDDSSCPAGAVCLPDLTCSADGEPVDAAGAPGDAAAPAADAGVAPDAAHVCAGELGCPCGADAECLGGACDAGQCVLTCADAADCADAEACVARVGGPAVCRAADALLCRPCIVDADCGEAGTGNRCVAQGVQGPDGDNGHFCGTACDAAHLCPLGFDCAGGQCAPAGGAACDCPARFQDFTTACARQNAFGTCMGERGCATACGASEPAAETCNGLDDNCDGQIDEDLTQACEADSAAGVCAGTERCVGGAWVGCDAPTPTVESCDDVDNDCNGAVDDGIVRVCSVSNAAGTCDGAESCVAGAWGGCDARTPSAETCDGVDENCDGRVDEDLSRACDVTNAAGTCHGTETCAAGAWVGCTAATPVAEICDDGIDNNCNGRVDENCGCTPGSTTACYTGEAATRRVGTCTDGLSTCTAQRQPGPCVGQTLPAAETCNGRDDDCDGTVDDGLSRACQVANPAGTCGGVETCSAGAWVGCNAATPVAEICDGLDNNCSGAADEALSRICRVANPFGTCSGNESCAGGAWVGCSAATPAAEACDGLDNNCNGAVDEGLSRACQNANGFGTCSGLQACGAGAWGACSAAVPVAEVCDNVDNNCNGAVDEGVTRACQNANGFGTCTGVQACGAGAWGACSAAVPAAEACDGIDNNCNGFIDETCLPHFSFFVTSYAALQQLSGSVNGFGGDLRFGQTGAGAGLRGADLICATIAEMSMAGASAKNWKAFLSVTNDGTGHQVNAIDRVGQGPWYDRLGRVFANTRADLLFDRPAGADAAIANDFPNEWGLPNHQPDPLLPQVDNHDMITGSNTLGTLYGATATCVDWTSSSLDLVVTGRPRVGHSWPRPCGPNPGGDRMCNWMSALTEAGCGAGVNLIDNGPPNPNVHTVGSGGGYGGFYCFALTP